jgi:hypothetical protein
MYTKIRYNSRYWHCIWLTFSKNFVISFKDIGKIILPQLPILAMQFIHFGFIALEHFLLFGFPIFRFLEVPDESYSRKTLCALSLISF